MPTVEIRRSALIGRSAADTFDLIEAAEHYPSFLPWCAAAVILARDDRLVSARLTVNYRGLRFDLTTRNPKERPRWMAIHLADGPFRRFEGEWRVDPLADEACRIEFLLRYEFDSRLVGRLASGRLRRDRQYAGRRVRPPRRTAAAPGGAARGMRAHGTNSRKSP